MDMGPTTNITTFEYTFPDGTQVQVKGKKKLETVIGPHEQSSQASREPVYVLMTDTGHRHLQAQRDLKLAVPLAAKVSFDDVVMSAEMRQQIEEAIEQINQHDLIFTDWGFSETIEKGRGVSMLFYGEPGTGKTLTAQGIADKLDRKLNIISTADIQSSSPGEAERNIRRHFKEAKGKDVIILFDECDSLIYHRGATGPIMSAVINELLSQLERFEGLTIFTTNRLGVLDEAVNRRLALKLGFPMPSLEERIKIWQRMFPKKAPLAKDIDWELLAGAEITGGYIKNAVLRAARMAATEKTAKKTKRITMVHLDRALQQEMNSMQEFLAAREAERGRTMQVTDRMGYNDAGQRVVTRMGSAINA